MFLKVKVKKKKKLNKILFLADPINEDEMGTPLG